MTPKHYQIWFMPGPGGKPYPVNDYPTLSETRFALDSYNRKLRTAGMYYIKPIYPVREMKTEALDKFVDMCCNVLILQNNYYADRTTEKLKEALVAETALDNYIASTKRKLEANPDYTPNEQAKQFFDLVAAWRTAFKTYHKSRKDGKTAPVIVWQQKNQADRLRSAMAEVVRQYKAAARNK